MPLEIKENVYWVGAIDWEERDFHNFEIPRGATYNAYLIVDEKIALVDTVKHKFFGEMLRRIEEIIDPREIDYIISNHVEIDHSGSLPYIKKIAKDAKVIATEKGRRGLCKYYDCADWEFQTVKTGDELKLGKKTLMFIEAPMLHWPDSMFTYVKEDKLLLPNDAFGQHIASVERFDEELGVEEALYWAKVYYANILMPLGNLVNKKLNELSSLEVDMIAPSHGVIWKNPSKIIEAYKKWANFEAEEKVCIVYDTMYHSTTLLAKSIAEGVASKGVEVRLFHTRRDPWSEIVAEILDARAVAVGSPTMHNNMFPPVAGFLNYLKGLKPKKKLGVAFGSCGWGGGAVREINKMLEQMGFEIIDEGLEVKFKPSDEELKKAFDLGVKIAEAVKTK